MNRYNRIVILEFKVTINVNLGGNCMGNRFVWEDDDITVRTDNKGLTCEDCILRLEKSGFCYAYAAKPKNILHGGGCEKRFKSSRAKHQR